MRGQKQIDNIRRRLGLDIKEDPNKMRMWFIVDDADGKQVRQECIYDEETYSNVAKSISIVDFGIIETIEGDYNEAKMVKEYILENFLPVYKERDKEDISLDPLAYWEKQMIIETLVTCDWVQKEAAEQLGISNRTLNYKISIFGITHPSWRVNTMEKKHDRT